MAANKSNWEAHSKRRYEGWYFDGSITWRDNFSTSSFFVISGSRWTSFIDCLFCKKMSMISVTMLDARKNKNNFTILYFDKNSKYKPTNIKNILEISFMFFILLQISNKYLHSMSKKHKFSSLLFSGSWIGHKNISDIAGLSRFSATNATHKSCKDFTGLNLRIDMFICLLLTIISISEI